MLKHSHSCSKLQYTFPLSFNVGPVKMVVQLQVCRPLVMSQETPSNPQHRF
jgi:hypothetical protein